MAGASAARSRDLNSIFLHALSTRPARGGPGLAIAAEPFERAAFLIAPGLLPMGIEMPVRVGRIGRAMYVVIQTTRQKIS